MLGFVPLALSAAQKAGLGVVGGTFIVFALLSALVLPTRWPQFPGRTGLRPFIVATVALFVGMMLAVVFLAKESEEEAGAGEHGGTAGETTTGPSGARTITVSEVDYRIELPSPETDGPASYTIRVRNDGDEVHNLVVSGPEVPEARTPNLKPGATAELDVTLVEGRYTLLCSIPGHEELGMRARLDVR